MHPSAPPPQWLTFGQIYFLCCLPSPLFCWSILRQITEHNIVSSVNTSQSRFEFSPVYLLCLWHRAGKLTTLILIFHLCKMRMITIYATWGSHEEQQTIPWKCMPSSCAKRPVLVMKSTVTITITTWDTVMQMTHHWIIYSTVSGICDMKDRGLYR